MSRDIPSALATAIQQPIVKVAFFAEFGFLSGSLRCWNGVGEKTWSGHTWTGLGDLAGVTPVDETTEVGAAGLTFRLGGVPSALIALALSDPYRGRPCKLWLANLDEDDEVVEALEVFAGRMDVMQIDDGGETSTIAITAENRLVDLGRPRSLRYTDAEQQRLFPGDRGLEYVAKLAERPLYWGVPTPAATSSPGYGSPGGYDGNYD